MPVEAIFLNVGQGDCTLLWFYDRGVDPATGKGTHAILIDCGSSGAVAPMTPPTGAKGNASALMVAHLKAKLANYLERLDNPRTLDALIITHPDKDHFNLLHKVLLDATGKLAYTIKTLYYTLDPMEYREGGGTFMKNLLTDPDTLTSPAGHKVEERPIAMDPQTEPLPLLSRDTSRANLLMLGGSWYGDGVIHGRKGPKRKRVEYTKEEIANQSSLVTVLQGERDSGGKRQRVLLMGDAVDITEMLLMGFDKEGLDGPTVKPVAEDGPPRQRNLDLRRVDRAHHPGRAVRQHRHAAVQRGLDDLHRSQYSRSGAANVEEGSGRERDRGPGGDCAIPDLRISADCRSEADLGGVHHAGRFQQLLRAGNGLPATGGAGQTAARRKP